MASLPIFTPGLTEPPFLTLLQGGQSGDVAAAIEAAGMGGEVGLLPGVGIVLAGARIETALLSNQHWDDFWLHAGSKIDDVWNSVYNFLSPPAKPSSADVKRIVNARAALQAEHARQVSTAHTAVELALGAVLHAEHVARVGMNNVEGSRIRNAYTQAVNVANVNYLKAVAHANALDAHQTSMTDTKIRVRTLETKAWAIETIQKPLATQALKTQAAVDTLSKSLKPIVEVIAAAEVARAVGPLASAIRGIQSQVATLAKESEDCTKPMCDTVGPKTDMGKLLKSVKVAKWLAAFAALETMDVKTLERIAGTIAGTEGAIGDWVANKILDELEGEHG